MSLGKTLVDRYVRGEMDVFGLAAEIDRLLVETECTTRREAFDAGLASARTLSKTAERVAERSEEMRNLRTGAKR